MARCRSCQAEILWVRTTNTGNLMPVDAEPNPDGNVEVQPEPEVRGVGGAVYSGTVHAQPPMLATGSIHMPHHATCPQADQWRHR